MGCVESKLGDDPIVRQIPNMHKNDSAMTFPTLCPHEYQYIGPALGWVYTIGPRRSSNRSVLRGRCSLLKKASKS